MSSKSSILKSIEKFQNQEDLEIKTTYDQTYNTLEAFKQNATLAGAKIYETNEKSLNNFLNELVYIYSDHFVYKCALGVAENGALWCDNLKEDRKNLFLCNDLIITIRVNTLVNTMHDAYEKLQLEKNSDKDFGTFIAGPSKTADIEQSLVLGAHGAMGLHIVIVDD